MSGSVLVAVAAAVGNLLQGWDNATIAGRFILSLLIYPCSMVKSSKLCLYYPPSWCSSKISSLIHCCCRGRPVH